MRKHFLKHIHDKGKFSEKNGYIVKNIIVRLCNQPWDVDSRLGGCGVCYFGNLGDKPTLHDGLLILRNNRKDIKIYEINQRLLMR